MSNDNPSGFTNQPTWREIGLRKIAVVNQELQNIQQVRIHQQNQINQSNQQNQNNLQKKLNEAVSENEYYRNLLSKPFAEIAHVNPDFKKQYEEQQLTIADWMVSQKAFKELAIQFGSQLGKSKDQVVKEGMDKEIDVLEDKHNPENRTNAGDSHITPYKEKLIAKIKNK
jgi:hypothetical protein